MRWHLLILSLPTENTSARMRAWRGLKSAGAAVLRDGVYLLPDAGPARQVLGEVAGDVEASGGTAYLLEVGGTDYPFEALFDRTEEYGRIAADLASLAERAAPPADQVKQLRKLRKAFDALRAIDFFPGEASRQTEALLSRVEERITAATHDGEPSPRSSGIPRRASADYQGRCWATRRRPWVDRLASAWLIRRFIDRNARFLWLDSPTDCPGDALGFDFDGAEFSHVDAGQRTLVTFETLLAAFGLEGDTGLAGLARIVHFLDIGGLPAAEAAGLETLLAGMRASIPDDDALLEAAAGALDFVYTSLKEPP